MFGNKLQKLFDRRFQSFEYYSEKIENELSLTVLPGCTAYLTTLDPVAVKRLNWVGFSKTHHRNIDTISLYGNAEYLPGEEYKDKKGNYIASLSELEAAHVSQSFQIIIPLAFAQEATQEEITAYLISEDAKAKAMFEAAIAEQDPDLIYEDSGLDDDEIDLAKLLAAKTNETLQ